MNQGNYWLRRINPVVVNPMLDEGLKSALTEVLLGMDEDPAGAAVLNKLQIDRFVVPEDALYDSVRTMRTYLRDRGLGP